MDWFREKDDDGLEFGYQVTEVLADEKSDFQHVQVFNTRTYGKMLVIDGFVMLTETDEFVYHEMISHIPMCHHQNPRTVCVIGGGDGGTVREILRHADVEKVVLCEIDKTVVDLSREYFPSVAGMLDDPRVEVRIGDGIQFVADHKAEFDLILVDSTDPVGPGEGLFTGAFYKTVKAALKPGGIMAAQSESPWAKAQFLSRIQTNIASGFQTVRPYVAPVPTYPRGLWSWTLATNDSELNFDEARFERLGSLSYLNKTLARGCFDLPPKFAEKFKS